MIKNTKIVLSLSLIVGVLSGCQTTSSNNLDLKRVACDTFQYTFPVKGNEHAACFTFFHPSNAPAERTSIFSDGTASLIDLVSYDNPAAFKKIAEEFTYVKSFDFERQISGSAKNIDAQEGKQFLANMKLNFLELDSQKELAVWRAKTTSLGINYHGYAFIKLFSKSSNKYQLAGYYLNAMDKPMSRSLFNSDLSSFEFKDITKPSLELDKTIEARLLEIQKLLEKNLITEKEAEIKRKEILKEI